MLQPAKAELPIEDTYEPIVNEVKPEHPLNILSHTKVPFMLTSCNVEKFWKLQSTFLSKVNVSIGNPLKPSFVTNILYSSMPWTVTFVSLLQPLKADKPIVDTVCGIVTADKFSHL